jgi:hypothetical protein
MNPAKGAHPTVGVANHIVLTSCNEEFPNATLLDTIGNLYPLASQRAIFVDRVVKNTKTAGFVIEATKVPTGDGDSLQTVSDAVVQNAVA